MTDKLFFWFQFLGGLCLGSLAVSAWYGGDHRPAVWFGFAGIFFILLALTFQIRKSLKPMRKKVWFKRKRTWLWTTFSILICILLLVCLRVQTTLSDADTGTANRPVLVFHATKIQFGPPTKQMGGGNDLYSFGAILNIGNVGPTPAVVKKFYMAIEDYSILPPAPDYEALFRTKQYGDTLMAIYQAGDHILGTNDTMPVPISKIWTAPTQDYDDFTFNRKNIYIIGVVEYEDVSRRTLKTLGFARKLLYPGLVLVDAGGAAYNYERTKDQ